MINQYKTFELDVNGTMKVIFCCMEPKKDENGKEKLELGRDVISHEEVFDAINDIHRSTGHMGMERTHTHCTDKYFSITQFMVCIYCRTCHICIEANLLLLLIMQQRSLSTQITDATVFKQTLRITGRCHIPTSMGRSSAGSWQ